MKVVMLVVYMLFGGVMSLSVLCADFKVDQKSEPHSSDALVYTTHIDHVIDPELKAYLLSKSTLSRMEKSPPLTRYALETRVYKDEKDLKEALETKGYFDASIHTMIDEAGDEYRITLRIHTGKRYRLSQLDVFYKNESRDVQESPITEKEFLPLKEGDPVDLDKAEELGKCLAKYWRERGYPFAKALTMKGILNYEHQTLALYIHMDRGPKCRFGVTQITGLHNLSKAYVQNRLDYREGDLYNELYVERTRNALVETGLFNDVHLAPQKKPLPIIMDEGDEESAVEEYDNQEGTVPLTLSLKEGPPRSMGAGGHYSSSYGVSGHASWRHDNVWGGGESFETRVIAGWRKNEARVALSLPDIGWSKQTLFTALSLKEEITRAFRATTRSALCQFLYDITHDVQVGYGVEAESSRIKRVRRTTHAKMIGIPVHLQVDTTNSVLNPMQGFKVLAHSTPYTGRYGVTRHFWSHSLFGSFYLRPLHGSGDTSDNVPVLATWGKMGHITAKQHGAIPPTKRLYSGGGNSVRGYGYQLLGPLDETSTPLGGRSLIEVGSEARLALSEKIGAALFIEGGSVSTKSTIKSKDFLWGVGLGARYYTAIGPLRLDLAFPLKRRMDRSLPPPQRKKVDAPFQFYISIGQAF